MKIKYWTAGILGIAALLVALALVLDFGGTGPAGQLTADPVGTQAQPPGPSQTAAPGQAPEAKEAKAAQTTAQGSTQPSQSARPTPTASSSKAPPAKAPSASATADGDLPLLEVPEPTDTPSPGLPKSTPRPAVLEKAPQDGEARGKLTRGFPSEQLPLPKNSSIIQSSVSTQAQRVIAGVQARTTQDAQAVEKFYRKYFQQHDWEVNTTTGEPGTVQLQGGFGQDSTTVKISQLPTGTTSITLSGAFKVGG